MKTYVDTSVWVALYTEEGNSEKVDKWYTACTDELVSAIWCMPEFASALSIKQRTGQLTSGGAVQAWEQFQQLCSNDIELLPIESMEYHTAAGMAFDTNKKLRAGDALHLACAQKYGVHSIATLDKIMAENAKKLKMKNIF